MALADTVKAEQAQVTAGTLTGCGASHPVNVAVSDCVRAVHLPDDQTHVGQVGDGMFIQWAQVAP